MSSIHHVIVTFTQVSCYEFNFDDLTNSVSDIASRMYVREKLFQPCPNYMRNQPDLQPRMRAVLFDWMMEVMIFFSNGVFISCSCFYEMTKLLHRTMLLRICFLTGSGRSRVHTWS
jgi:hypothetical protein